MNPYNRAEILDINFSKKLKNGSLPNNITKHSISDLGLKSTDIISIFESQVFSRHMDIKARELKEKGECFYTIGSSGHESNAVFGHIFPYTDIAFLHYRSGPFFIERSKQIPGSSPLYDMALSFMASSDDPISGGRHKVIGSKKLNVPPQTSTIASHIPKAVGTAFGIDRARDLKIKEKELESNSLVLCSFGDASANHATALSGINTARWIRSIGGNVPIVFICEDNGLGISVPTPKDKGPAKPLLSINSFQALSRDFAFVVDEAVSADALMRAVKAGGKPFVSDVRIFDVYAGDKMEAAKKSIALNVTIQPQKATLVDAEIVEISDKIIASVSKNCGGQIRG